MIETRTLILDPWSTEQIIALIESTDRFEDLTGAAPADGLREFFVGGEMSPEWLERLRRDIRTDVWTRGFRIVNRDAGVVIGTAGFKGPPDDDGVVEIAYGIVPSFEGRGYATEAARALVDYAFSSGMVKRIRAHTLPEDNASTKVLKHCGFDFVGDVIDPEDGPVWRWERYFENSGSPAKNTFRS